MDREGEGEEEGVAEGPEGVMPLCDVNCVCEREKASLCVSVRLGLGKWGHTMMMSSGEPPWCF